MTLSQDRKRFYLHNIAFEDIEIVDIAQRKVIDSFRLSEGNKKMRIFGVRADPLNRFMILFVKTATKQVDRFEISAPTLLQYDLKEHKVTRTIPWPNGEEREGVGMQFSPDGKLLYLFFGEDILIYDTTTFKQVDKWELSQPHRRRLRPDQLRLSGRSQRGARLLHRHLQRAGSGAEPPHHGDRARQPGEEERGLLSARPGHRGAASRWRRAGNGPMGCTRRSGSTSSGPSTWRTTSWDRGRSSQGRPRMALKTSSNGKIALHLPGRQHDRSVRGRHFQVPAHHHAGRRHDHGALCHGGAVTPLRRQGYRRAGTSAAPPDCCVRAPYWRKLTLVLALSLISTGAFAGDSVSFQGPDRPRAVGPGFRGAAPDPRAVRRDHAGELRAQCGERAAVHARFGGDSVRHAAVRCTGTCSGSRRDSTRRRGSGDIVSRINNDIGEIQRIAAETVLAWVGNVLFLAGSIVMLLWLDARLFLVSIALVPASVWALTHYRQAAGEQGRHAAPGQRGYRQLPDRDPAGREAGGDVERTGARSGALPPQERRLHATH